MKKIIIAFSLVLFFCTVAVAEWLVDFKDIYLKDGIDPAVVEALKQGASPYDIMGEGLLYEDLNPQNLVKALFCAGVEGADIRAAAENWQVSEMLVEAGYKKSIEECGDALVDTQAYTPVGVPASFAGGQVPSSGGTYASTSSFQ